jgi:trehalose synthase
VLCLPEYAHDLSLPQRFIMPAINPFSAKNKEMSEDEIRQCLAHYQIPTDLPLVVQVSRFDKWKDPQGVLDAFHIARKKVDCTLVLVGNSAVDDPEGEEIFQSIYDLADERTIVILADDPVLVNALQRAATIVLQKSIREGFGLTVTEAMWKRACVIGGNVGGIRHQITDGEDGFLVENVVETAARIVQLLKQPELRRRIGDKAHETVRQNFLMSRLMEDWIDLVGSMASRSTVASPARRTSSGIERSRI